MCAEHGTLITTDPPFSMANWSDVMKLNNPWCQHCKNTFVIAQNILADPSECTFIHMISDCQITAIYLNIIFHE